jgi:hypothetical protein
VVNKRKLNNNQSPVDLHVPMNPNNHTKLIENSQTAPPLKLLLSKEAHFLEGRQYEYHHLLKGDEGKEDWATIHVNANKKAPMLFYLLID